MKIKKSCRGLVPAAKEWEISISICNRKFENWILGPFDQHQSVVTCHMNNQGCSALLWKPSFQGTNDVQNGWLRSVLRSRDRKWKNSCRKHEYCGELPPRLPHLQDPPAAQQHQLLALHDLQGPGRRLARLRYHQLHHLRRHFIPGVAVAFLFRLFANIQNVLPSVPFSYSP